MAIKPMILGLPHVLLLMGLSEALAFSTLGSRSGSAVSFLNRLSDSCRRFSCLRAIGSSSFAEHPLHALDDPIARNQHAADDHETEDHELQRGGQSKGTHHLVEPGQEYGGGEGGDRAGQPPGE